jgi:hypothetical protein
MPLRFRFADAYWFRVPLKVLVLTVTVFGLVSIAPSVTQGTVNDHQRAIFGLAVMLLFAATATTVAVAINDSAVEVDDHAVYIRFEAFFHAVLPMRDIVAIRYIDPKPAWRFRFGLSTNFIDRVSCSHGGRMIELELATPSQIQLWPRHLEITTFWLAVREHEAFIAEINRRAPRLAAASRAPLAKAA